MIVELLDSPEFEKDFDFSAGVDLEEDAARLVGPVQSKGKVSKENGAFVVNASITGELELDCTRCLVPIRQHLDLPVKVTYVDSDKYAAETETQLDVDDLEIAVIENAALDLDQMVREQIILSLPTQFFCKEDCQGLCEKCGVNKNVTKCGCAGKEIDPRWSQLKNLKF